MKTRLALIVIAGLGLSACMHDMNDLEQYVNQVKARKTRHIEPLPQMKPYEAFTYLPGNRRDPFVPTAPTRESASSSNLRPDMNRNKEPLEEFPLDSLQMQGTLVFSGKTYAMVKAPDGVVHRVAVGDHLGQNFGTINKIEPSEIDLTEIVPDGFGGWIERPATLALAE
jgi:type IV pilus assembly protein PilP